MDVVEGKTDQEIKKVRTKLEGDLDFLNSENTELRISVSEIKQKL